MGDHLTAGGAAQGPVSVEEHRLVFPAEREHVGRRGEGEGGCVVREAPIASFRLSLDGRHPEHRAPRLVEVQEGHAVDDESATVGQDDGAACRLRVEGA